MSNILSLLELYIVSNYQNLFFEFLIYFAEFYFYTLLIAGMLSNKNKNNINFTIYINI